MKNFRFKPVYKYLTFMLFMLSLLTFIPPMVYSLYVEDKEILSFIVPIFISLFLFSLSAPIKTQKLTEKEALFIAVSVWFLFPALTSISYVISGYIPDPINAYFESVSGFTTTGASILTNIEILPKSILFMRNLTNWVGGLGFAVFAVSFLSTKLPIGKAIVKFESSKIVEEKIEPRVKEVTKIVFSVYILLTATQIILMKIAGVKWYDAFTFTFATVATGGFAPYNQSAGVFNSFPVEVIITVFMILGAINLQLYYLILKKKSLKVFFKDQEVIVYLSIIGLSVLFATLILYIKGYYHNVYDSFRFSLFQIVSAATTTGFSTTDYSNWHYSVLALMMIIALIGAVGGSTGGGIKVYRLIVIGKTIYGEIKRIAHPKVVYKLIIKGKPVNSSTLNMFWAFLSLYLFTVLIGGFILTLGDHDLITSFSASIACITSLGPGLADVGPASNFAGFNDFEKLILSFEMIFGRLEIIPVISLLFFKEL
ncbi:TrkH family potassium uptake protein [Persephonella sp.]|uniref:TrkH family potassium uptake protein n=1 Tax=Persephonella sp. TaxID=2060922 RepID=UPI00262284FC|nr:TrkH family potassium uptake protein [Persephonella sp.]